MSISSQYNKNPGIFIAGGSLALVALASVIGKGAKTTKMFSVATVKAHHFGKEALPLIGVAAATNMSAAYMAKKFGPPPTHCYFHKG